MRKISILLTFMTLVWFSCTKDMFVITRLECDEDRVTFDDQMQSIIEFSCAYSGCHIAGNTAGLNDYTTYKGLEPDLSRMFDKVVTQQFNANLGMPPDYAPEGRPKDLTDEEFMLFNCWINQDFPEN